ncbi:MAG TPA: sigma-70 family RNA polymerase sigma factor [Flavisolibacter sp.]|nr:sigma-70 family RNA polymerase sigma factor [Flavisolibacter sp.]
MQQLVFDNRPAAIALSGEEYYFYSSVQPEAGKSDPPKMTLSIGTVTGDDLVVGCMRNERRAQEQLYKKYCGAMLSLCLSYVKNEQEAIEVLQDGFLKVFQQISRFDSSKSTVYTWIRTIVLRTAIDHLRKKNQKPDPVEWKEAYDPAINAEAVQRMSSEEILYLLHKLPATTRAVFNLYVVEGFNHREIGELLEISEGTSKWHLSEARKNLSKSLKIMERA